MVVADPQARRVMDRFFSGRHRLFLRRAGPRIILRRRWPWRGPRQRLSVRSGGTLWVSTEGGLSRLKNNRVATLTSKNGLPCDTVHWAIEDNDHSFWLYTACGLVRIARSELDAWAAAVDK